MSSLPETCDDYNSIIGKQTTLYFDNPDGRLTALTTFIVCPNPECKKYTLTVSLHRSEESLYGREDTLKELIKDWRLIPPSNAKPFPNYIPKPLIDDYTEACLIKENSPKASATLATLCAK